MPKTTSSSVFSKVVGVQIRIARKTANLTQKELALRMNTSPAYIAALEAGRYNLTLGQLEVIANALGLAVEVSFLSPPTEWRDIKFPSLG